MRAASLSRTKVAARLPMPHGHAADIAFRTAAASRPSGLEGLLRPKAGKWAKQKIGDIILHVPRRINERYLSANCVQEQVLGRTSFLRFVVPRRYLFGRIDIDNR